jgi:multiple antibiotic resistance protein
MLGTVLAFIVMINPFALFLYLQPVMKELDSRKFIFVLAKASFISFAIYMIFLWFGNALFEKVFMIHFDSFRIFGGIVIFSFAYYYIVKGQKALLHIKENLDDLASEIALPFMVGAGTISLVILMSHNYDHWLGTLLIALALGTSIGVILLMKFIRDRIPGYKFKVAFDKVMEVLLRLMGFFVGAIGIDMIYQGVSNLMNGGQ